MKSKEVSIHDTAHTIAPRIVFCFLAAIVIIVPAAFSPWTVESGRIKLLLLQLSVAAMLALIAFITAWSGKLRIPRYGLHIAVVVWLLVNAASALLSPYPYASLNELWRLTMFIGLYVAVVWSVRTERAARTLAWLCLAAAGIVVIYGIAQRLGYDIVTYSQSPQDRLFSSLGNPNMLAGFLLLMIWTAVGAGIDARAWPVREPPLHAELAPKQSFARFRVNRSALPGSGSNVNGYSITRPYKITRHSPL